VFGKAINNTKRSRLKVGWCRKKLSKSLKRVLSTGLLKVIVKCLILARCKICF
jgi:hypothetical protein